LLLKSFQRLNAVDLGFNPEQTLTMVATLPATKYKDGEQALQFYNRAIEELRTAPGIKSVGLTTNLPFGEGANVDGFFIEGQELPSGGNVSESAQTQCELQRVTSGTFQTLGIPLLQGRDFQDSDTSKTTLVAIIDEPLARRFWPQGDAIGKRIETSGDREWMTIVGIVGDVKHWSLMERPEEELYVPLAQQPARNFVFVARVESERPPTIAGLRDVLYAVDPLQPSRWQPLRSLVDSTIAEPRFRSLLIGAFAVVAVTLAVVGLYGLISFGVTQRTRELGVRVALGARRVDIIGLVLRDGVRLAVIGVAIGVPGALAATRLLAGLLYQVSATDAATFIIVPVVLTTTALVANYLPARRAAEVDPVEALRAQ